MRVFLSIIGILIAVEIGVRISEALDYEGRVGVLSKIIERGDNKDYWTLRPNTIIVQPEHAHDTSYRISSLGFRGEEPADAPTGLTSLYFLWPPGHCRLIKHQA